MPFDTLLSPEDEQKFQHWQGDTFIPFGKKAPKAPMNTQPVDLSALPDILDNHMNMLKQASGMSVEDQHRRLFESGPFAEATRRQSIWNTNAGRPQPVLLAGVGFGSSSAGNNAANRMLAESEADLATPPVVPSVQPSTPRQPSQPSQPSQPYQPGGRPMPNSPLPTKPASPALQPQGSYPPATYNPSPSPERTKIYGNRADGTPKGPGFFGEIPNLDKPSYFSTELTTKGVINGKPASFPLLVPTLTRDEIDLLVSGDKANDARYKPMLDQIVLKAQAFATERLTKGLSPFATHGEQVPLPLTEEQAMKEAYRKKGFSEEDAADPSGQASINASRERAWKDNPPHAK